MRKRLEEAREEEHWISISDIMSGLMMFFLFIAIAYIRPVAKQRDSIKEIVVTFREAEVNLYEALEEEFKNDLKFWDAEIDKDNLSVRFKSPEVLFSSGSSTINDNFKTILNDFFPRYLETLSKFYDKIEEVRIEGHTSSDWKGLQDKDAYFKNMALSQERTRSVLEHVLSLPSVSQYRDWASKHITANGLSSSRLVIENNIENAEKSRRVEFKVLTNAKQQIVKILETVQ